MKTAKLLITVLITIGILLVGFFTFRFSTAGINTIGNSVTIAYIFSLLLVLLSYRVSFAGNTKPNHTQTILAIGLIIGFSFMYFQRSSILYIWNYVLSGFTVLQGLNLIGLHKASNKLASIFQLTAILSLFFLSILFILKVSNPLYYVIALVILVPPSILSLIDSFKSTN